MNKEEKYQLIEDYLEGNLANEKLALAEQMIKVDSEFAAEVNLHKELKETFGEKSIVDLSNKIRDITNYKQERRNSIFKIILIILFLISLLAVGFILFGQSKQSNQELFEQFADIPTFQNYNALYNSRKKNEEKSDQLSEDPLWATYFDLYNENQLDQATEILNKIQVTDLNSIDLQFQSGLLAFRKGNFEKAVDYFKSAEIGQDMSKWYLALCYLNLDQISKAKIELQEISNSIHPRSKESNQLLKLIN